MHGVTQPKIAELHVGEGASTRTVVIAQQTESSSVVRKRIYRHRLKCAVRADSLNVLVDLESEVSAV